eukprot:scaffold1654_cov340-Prasinococcus_capsulatus_cf.AAC.9
MHAAPGNTFPSRRTHTLVPERRGHRICLWPVPRRGRALAAWRALRRADREEEARLGARGAIVISSSQAGAAAAAAADDDVGRRTEERVEKRGTVWRPPLTLWGWGSVHVACGGLPRWQSSLRACGPGQRIDGSSAALLRHACPSGESWRTSIDVEIGTASRIVYKAHDAQGGAVGASSDSTAMPMAVPIAVSGPALASAPWWRSSWSRDGAR